MGPALGPNPNTPAISMERRQGMPSPTGKVADTEETLDKPEETGKVAGPEAPVVHKLPRAAATKRYSIIEPEEELDEPDESESEPESEST
jgi:hypothetical protein